MARTPVYVTSSDPKSAAAPSCTTKPVRHAGGQRLTMLPIHLHPCARTALPPERSLPASPARNLQQVHVHLMTSARSGTRSSASPWISLWINVGQQQLGLVRQRSGYVMVCRSATTMTLDSSEHPVQRQTRSLPTPGARDRNQQQTLWGPVRPPAPDITHPVVFVDTPRSTGLRRWRSRGCTDCSMTGEVGTRTRTRLAPRRPLTTRANAPA